MIKKMNLFKIALFAGLSAVFYVSSLFISDIISFKSTILAFIYILVIAFVYGMSLVSEERKSVIIKWLLSIPLSYLVLQYFWKTHYSIRALNWIFPDYGRQTSGGNFAGFILMIFFSVLCLAGGIAALSFKPENYESFEKIQISVSCIFGVIIIFAVIFLERQFPSYAHILSNL